MITRTEVYKDGHREIYHRAGLLTTGGDRRPDEKYVWTHPESERASCDACVKGTIPKEVVKS